MPEPSDRDRLWALQQKLAELADVLPLTATAVLELADEIDVLVNRLMGIGVPAKRAGMEGDPVPHAEDPKQGLVQGERHDNARIGNGHDDPGRTIRGQTPSRTGF